MGPVMACGVDRPSVFLRRRTLIGPHTLIILAIGVKTFPRLIRVVDANEYHVGRINCDTTVGAIARIPGPTNLPPKSLDMALDSLVMVPSILS